MWPEMASSEEALLKLGYDEALLPTSFSVDLRWSLSVLVNELQRRDVGFRGYLDLVLDSSLGDRQRRFDLRGNDLARSIRHRVL
jgi:hypothetical protein